MTWEAAEDAGAVLAASSSPTAGEKAAESMRRVPVDLGALAEALDDHAPGHDWYLDLGTGDVLPVFEDFEDELLPVSREEWEESPRFLNIPPRASREGWRDMADFIATVDDGGFATAAVRCDRGEGCVWPVQAGAPVRAGRTRPLVRVGGRAARGGGSGVACERGD
jgi:hypothetical protein